MNAPGLLRPPAGRCPGVRAIVRPVARGPAPGPRTMSGTGQPPSEGSAAGSAAGTGVPRRVTVPSGAMTRYAAGPAGTSPAATAALAICGRGPTRDDPLLEPLHLLGALGVLRLQLGGLERVDGDRGVEDQQPEGGADEHGDDQQHERRTAGRGLGAGAAAGRAGVVAAFGTAGTPARLSSGRTGVARAGRGVVVLGVVVRGGVASVRGAVRRRRPGSGARAGTARAAARSLMPPAGSARRPAPGRTPPGGWPRPRPRRPPRRPG